VFVATKQPPHLRGIASRLQRSQIHVFAIPSISVRAIACVVFYDWVDIFGGKDETGDGTPEGLPLICRFF